MGHRAGGIRLNKDEIRSLGAVDDGAGEFCAPVQLLVPAALAAHPQHAVGRVLAVIGVVEGAVVVAGAAVGKEGPALVEDDKAAGIVVGVVPAIAALHRQHRGVRLP